MQYAKSQGLNMNNRLQIASLTRAWLQNYNLLAVKFSTLELSMQ